jgi:hypothetical protein
MTRIRLSDEAIDGLLPLASISSDQFSELITELEKSLVVSLKIEDDLERLLEASPLLAPLEPRIRDAFIEALSGVHYLCLSSTTSESDLLDAIKASLQSNEPEKIAKLDVLIKNISLLIKVRVLRASAKAWSLISDHEKIFLNSRILTDIRPVFEEDVDKPLMASLILHTLKLTMRVDGIPQTVYLAADSDDLRDLQLNIERALSKANYLSNQIGMHLQELGPSLDMNIEN